MKRLTASVERDLIVGTTAAFSAFSAPQKIIVEGDPKREILTSAARIDAEDDCSLALIEIPASDACGKRIEAYLAPDDDLDDEKRQLRDPMCLYWVVERPAPTYVELIPRMDPDAWLKPTQRALKRALKPIVDRIEKRPLN